jgi:hypothetical protein
VQVASHVVERAIRTILESARAMLWQYLVPVEQLPDDAVYTEEDEIPHPNTPVIV